MPSPAHRLSDGHNRLRKAILRDARITDGIEVVRLLRSPVNIAIVRCDAVPMGGIRVSSNAVNTATARGLEPDRWARITHRTIATSRGPRGIEWALKAENAKFSISTSLEASPRIAALLASRERTQVGT